MFRNSVDPLTGNPLGRPYNHYEPPARAGDNGPRAAVRRTLDHPHRVGRAGSRQVTTRGMIAAAFDHWDTRAGDPNLHTHVVIANKVMATRLLEARHDVTVWNRTGRCARTGRTPAPPGLSVDRAHSSRPERPSQPT